MGYLLLLLSSKPRYSILSHTFITFINQIYYSIFAILNSLLHTKINNLFAYDNPQLWIIIVATPHKKERKIFHQATCSLKSPHNHHKNQLDLDSSRILTFHRITPCTQLNHRNIKLKRLTERIISEMIYILSHLTRFLWKNKKRRKTKI